MIELYNTANGRRNPERVVATLRNWEQDRRTPKGPALAMLRLTARNPEAVVEALHRGSSRGAA